MPAMPAHDPLGSDAVPVTRSFRHVRVGDRVLRLLAGLVPMPLRVTGLDDELIHCGPWRFDRDCGAEVDGELGWGPAHGITGSCLVAVHHTDA